MSASVAETLPAWDLSDLYPGPDSPELEADFAKADTRATIFATTYAGKLPGENLEKAIEEFERIEEILGSDAESLLGHACKTIPASSIHQPGPDFIDRVTAASDRPIPVLRSLQQMYGNGRLANTGFLSILPVDQGIEHSAGASFAKNPAYFDPSNIIELAIEGGCNAVATTFGVLGSVSRKYAHRIPFMVKYNHNELLTYPNAAAQIPFGTVREAWNLGACAIGATIYFGSTDAAREIVEEAMHQVLEVRADGDSRLAQLLDLMYLGDWVSCYMALDNDVDPGPIEAIFRLKDRMAQG